MDPVEYLKINPFVLAPMAGITDCAFRTFMREMGAGVVVTELVSATGLRYSSDRTRTLMKFEDVQHPIGIQLFGDSLEDLAYGAKEVEQMGADFVDLNFGCPVPKVVKKGAGAAVLKDLIHLRNVLRTVKGAVKIPVTIKVRTGWDQESRNTDEVVQVAADEGISWVAIHGRTRAQAYTGKADWEYIRSIAEKSPIPILGNGDIQSAQTAVRRLTESKSAGVLIGRGCLKNPWIFRESLAKFHGKTDESEKNFSVALNSLAASLERCFDDRMVALQLKKFSAWFSAGYPGSANFRKKIFTTISKQDVIAIANDYYSTVGTFVQQDTSEEAFLMGGHG